MRRLYSSLLGSIIALAFILSPLFAYATTKLSFTGTSSGTMFLSAPPVASGTVILPTLSGGTAYLIDGTRRISTSSPLNGGGALSSDLSLSLDLSANYVWRGIQNASSATSILPNSLGLPSSCSPASVYVNLSGPTAQKLYVCEANNTWVAVGSSVTSTNLKNNFTGNANPTASNDTGENYAVGSRWINVTDDTQFVAVNVDSSAARWFRTDIGNARFSGTRKGEVLDLNYYNVAGSTADLATQINFWTNSYANPGNTVADTTIERESGDNGHLKIVNQGDGDILLQSGDDFFVDLDSDNDSYDTKVFNIRSDIPGTSTAVSMASFRDDGGLILDNSRETEYFSKCWLEADNTTASLDQCLYATISMQDTTALQLRGSAGNVCSTRSFSDCVSGTCSGGGNNGLSCDNDRDCPPAVAGTSCTDNDDCATNYECRPYPYKSFDTTSEAPLGKYCTSSEPCLNNINSATATVSSDCTQTVAQYCISNGAGPYAAFYATNPYRGLSGASQQLGKIIFYTNKGVANSYEDVARLQVYASQAHTTSAFGTSLLFQTVPNGSSTLQTRFQLIGDGTSKWSSDNITDGVQMDATGKLYKDGSGSIVADALSSSVTADGAISIATGSNGDFTIDPNGTGNVNITDSELFLANGTSANPVISNTGDSNTGIYFPGGGLNNNLLALVTAGGPTSNGAEFTVRTSYADFVGETGASLYLRHKDLNALSGVTGPRLYLQLGSTASGGRKPDETDSLGAISFQGSDDEGSTHDTAALIIASPSDEWTTTDHRTDLKIQTVSNGVAALSNRFALLSDGSSYWTKDNATNGVEMTTAGILQKRGTGSVVADKVSSATAVTVETTASNGNIQISPDGTGQVIVYGDTLAGQVGASGTMVITDDDTTSVQLALTSNLAGTTTPSTITMLKRNGTTSVVAGEQLSRITSYGYENVGTAANKIAGTIGFDANEAFNDSQAGSNFVLGLTGDGANTLETRFKILGDGSSYLTKDSGVNGVEMTTDGYLQKKGTGRVIADHLTSTVNQSGTGYFNFTSPNTIRMIVDNDDNSTAQFEVREGAGNNLVMAVFDSGKLILVDDAETNTGYSTLVSGTLEVNSGGTGGSMDNDAIAVNRVADDANGVYIASGRARGTTGCSGGNTHCLAKTGDVLFMGRHFGRGDSSANYANGTCSTTTGTSCTSDANCPGSETCIHAGMVEAARVSIKADGDWSPTNAGSMFSVQLQPSGVAPSANFGNTQVRFRLRADGSGYWTKDGGTNGVELTSSGVLQKKGTGSIVADAVASGTPSSATAACTAGTINYDANYIYICVATNTWKRAALTGGW